MAHVDHFAAHHTASSLRQRLARLLETPFDRRYRQRTETIAALRSKSDSDLAAMGLTRDEILAHVFGSRHVLH